MSLEITDEHKEAWRGNIGTYLADALVIALAGQRKAEFLLEHKLTWHSGIDGHRYQLCGNRLTSMQCCGENKDKWDHRHNYSDDDWLREARGGLSK
jgi:hypothetical protein